jgi:Fe-S cluster assembly protein SufB
MKYQEEIKQTYEKLGIPEAERTYLAGVTAQYESEVVYHKNREDLEKLGVLFCDMDTAVREYPELVQEYFGTVIPPGDNKFAALNSAVWSGGSFIYVPKGVHVEDPLQAYFRINAENMGQFERTLILVDEGASVHYIEGCSAPVYTTDALHSAVVEIVVKPSGLVDTQQFKIGQMMFITRSQKERKLMETQLWNGLMQILVQV